MSKEELIERLKKMVRKFKAEAEWGSMFACGSYYGVAVELEKLIEEAE